MLYFIAYILAVPILTLIYRPKVLNRKALRQKGRVIYVANHLTMGDPIALAAIIPRVVHFMAKATLSDNRFMAWVFRQLLTFPVVQYTADTKAIRRAIDLLEQEKAFGVFPEGHRATDGTDMDTIDKGCAFIAVRANAPIVPMYIMPQAFKLGGRWKIAVGDPIYPEEVAARCPAKKPVDAVNAALADEMMTLREQARSL